jgi:hypothetical protein
MSQFRDVIARMAVDAEFARHARSHPDQVANEYGLSAEETSRLRGLADASAGTGPQALGVRLSKSGVTTGGLASMVAGGHPGVPDLHLDPHDAHDLHPADGSGHPSLEIGPKQDDPAPPPPENLHVSPSLLHPGGDAPAPPIVHLDAHHPDLPDFPGLGHGDPAGPHTDPLPPGFHFLPGESDDSGTGSNGGGEAPPVFPGLSLGELPEFHLPTMPGHITPAGDDPAIHLPGLFTDSDGDGTPDVIDPDFTPPPTPLPPHLPPDIFPGGGVVIHPPLGDPPVPDPGGTLDPSGGGVIVDPPLHTGPPSHGGSSHGGSSHGGSSHSGSSHGGTEHSASAHPVADATPDPIVQATQDADDAAASSAPSKIPAPAPSRTTGGVDSGEVAMGVGGLAAGVVAGGVAGGVAGAAMASKKTDNGEERPAA